MSRIIVENTKGKDTITYKRRKASSKTSVDVLKDDEVVEIFLRLALDCIHRCKCVCKRWKGLISDPWFIRSYINRVGTNMHQLLLYHIEEEDEGMKSAASSYFGHKPLPKSLFPCACHGDCYQTCTKFFDFSFSFLPIKIELLRKFQVVRISHGLLLCKAEFRPRTRKPYRVGVYYVCNPLTKQWLKIPPLIRRRTAKVGPVGFMCKALDPEFPWKIDYFMVLEVEYKRSKDDNFFYTHVFSSQTGCWNNYRVTGGGSGFNWFWRSWQIHEYVSVVVHNGMFHWCAERSKGPYIIAYDPLNHPNKCNCLSTSVMPGYKCNQISLHAGHIRGLVYSESNPYCYLYDLDYDAKHWLRKFSFKNLYQIPEYNELSFFTFMTGDIIYRKNYNIRRFRIFNTQLTAAVIDFDQPQHLKTNTRFATFLYSWTSWPTAIPQLRDTHLASSISFYS